MTEGRRQGSESRKQSLHTLVTPLIVACALFMEQLDGSIIATALPTISRSLHTDPLHLNLAITSYMFSLAVFIPLSGWIADRFGARTVFRWAIVIFVIGSACCGVSQNLLTLVLARILQGAGGAMMTPVGRLVLLRVIPRAKLVDAMAWVTVPALIGPVLGPPVGGLIVTYFSWRWIFYLNLPIGILGLVLATLFIDNIREETQEPLDVKGFLLMGFALAGLVFGFETAGRHLVSDTLTVSFLTGGAICLALYCLHVRRIKHPIIDVSVMKFPTFRASMLGGSLMRIGVGAMPFLVPVMLQVGFGLDPAASGLITLAGALGAMAMKLAAQPVIRAFGFRPVLIAISVGNAISLAVCAFFTPDTSHAVIFAVLLGGGFIRSLQFTALNTIAFAETPVSLLSRANTFYSMMQQLTLSLGVAVGAALLNLTLHWHGHAALGAGDFGPAYIGIAVLSLLSMMFFLPLSPRAGEEMSGHGMEAEKAIVKDPV